MAIYSVGAKLRLSATFSSGGVPTDTTVTLRVRNPGRAVTTLTTTRTGAGAYEYVGTFTQAGSYAYAWSGTGAVVARAEGTFEIQGDEDL